MNTIFHLLVNVVNHSCKLRHQGQIWDLVVQSHWLLQALQKNFPLNSPMTSEMKVQVQK